MYESLIETCKNEFKKNLVAAIKYGAEGEPDNLLLVFNQLDYETMALLRKVLKQYNGKLPAAPIFFTKKELMEAADVFPLEFLDIKYPHHVLHGTDVVNMIKFEKKNVRQQLEYECRSKLIHLRAHYLWLKNPDELRALLGSVVPSIMPLCYGLLFLRDLKPAAELENLFSAVEEHYKINMTILKRIRHLRKMRDADLHHVVRELMEFLAKLSEIVDKAQN